MQENKQLPPIGEKKADKANSGSPTSIQSKSAMSFAKIPPKPPLKNSKPILIQSTKQENVTTKTKTEPKTRKNRLSKKFYYISGTVFLSLVIIAVLVFVILGNIKENEQLIISNNSVVEVINIDNQYFLEVPEHEIAVYYIFEITQDDLEPFLIFSQKNKIDVSEYFNQKSIFSLRYYVQKTREKSRSLPSEQTIHIHQESLTAPILSYDNETNKMSWNYVENAVSYEFFYATDEDVESFDINPVYTEDDEGHGSLQMPLDFGRYLICVVAHPNDTVFYSASPASNTIEVEYFGKRQNVFDASYNLTDQTLFIDASNLDQEEHDFVIYIGEQEFIFSPQMKQDNYVINLADNGITITIGIDVIVVTKGDGSYLLNSDGFLASASI